LKAQEIITDEVIENIRSEIKKASGREIFIRAEVNFDEDKIDDFEVLARGDETRAPAITSGLGAGCLVIHNHPSGDLEPSGPDIRIASRIGDRGVGFAIIDNKVENIYTVVEPQEPREIKSLEPEEIVSLFSPGGKMEKKLNDYEYRSQQIDVVHEVIETFNNQQESFIEAGTGTGKSFAYLVPALYWNHLNDRPVVVSTNTINLQEQIIDKDLVFLQKILPFSFESKLVKGRRNYVCLRKADNMENRVEELFSEEPEKQQQFVKILNWLQNTKQGSRSDINFMVQQEVWHQVVSESDVCISTNCPFYGECYFMQARREIHEADILVVNHHLLLADAGLRQENQSLLPAYKHLILDEAHNFPRTATHELGRAFRPGWLERFFQRVDTSRFSLITRLRNRVGAIGEKQKKDIINLLDNIISRVKNCREVAQEYFNTLANFYGNHGDRMYRITADIREKESWTRVQSQGDSLLGQLSTLGVKLDKLYKQMNFLADEKREEFEELILELELASNRCQSFIETLDFNLQNHTAEKEDYVFWLQKDEYFKGAQISQENAPLNISELLPEILWDRLSSLIITSATLTINDNFKFFRQSLGLPGARKLRVDSPFDYKKQARLLIPRDIPTPGAEKFLEEIIEEFKEMLASFGGSTMVLFTSYSMLNYCLEHTRPDLEQKGLRILAQGEFPRHYILNNFKAQKSQIIFGTVSFWEGVDIKGDDLKYLIIMKLPFPVPSRPVAAARKEKLEQEGKNPFYHYSLPRAVIRFKQGFGRLIRSRKDRGVIISLDNRLLQRSYGKVFLNSLPDDCSVEAVDMESLKTVNFD